MSDDLVKRLRDDSGDWLTDLAADRIEELEAQIKKDALQYLSDTGQMGDTIDDLTRRHEHALRKIDVLEDQLAKAVEALEKIAQHDMQYWAITTLAELKGGKDE